MLPTKWALTSTTIKFQYQTFLSFYSSSFVFNPTILFFHSVHFVSLYSSFIPRFRNVYKSQCHYVMVEIQDRERIQRVSTLFPILLPRMSLLRRNNLPPPPPGVDKKPLWKFLTRPSCPPDGLNPFSSRLVIKCKKISVTQKKYIHFVCTSLLSYIATISWSQFVFALHSLFYFGPSYYILFHFVKCYSVLYFCFVKQRIINRRNCL